MRFDELDKEIIACRKCPRLVEWREQVAREKRKAYRDWEYWGKPVPGFGDRKARVLVVGLAPGAPTGPAARLPVTARAASCTRRCTAPASPTSPPPWLAATAWLSKTS